MKGWTRILFLILLLCLVSILAWSNVYVVIYATYNGRTGHAGIAIDNYRIQKFGEQTDTVADGTLTYFDVWPETDDFGLLSLSRDCAALYYQLPNHIWPSPITVTSLYDRGIPHREHYPCDALLMIPTTAASDNELRRHLNTAIASNKFFNPRHFNCSDFVRESLYVLTHQKLRAKEFMPFSFTSTPNKLCRALMKLTSVVVIKSPEKKIKRHFIPERIFKKKPVHNPFVRQSTIHPNILKIKTNTL